MLAPTYRPQGLDPLPKQQQQGAYAPALATVDRLFRSCAADDRVGHNQVALVTQAFCAIVQVRALDRLTAALEAHTAATAPVGVIGHTEDGTAIVRHVPGTRHS